MSVAISVRNLTKHYSRQNDSITVLNNLSLDINSGEFMALMGPSGSGKTTLLNIIAGIDQPSSGSVNVFGNDISAMSEAQLSKWRANNVGFIFQFYNLIPVLTAYENVELPLMLTPLSKTERRQQVENALAIVGLADRTKHTPNQLSGGQQQRVAIARAIAMDPNLIVADEPTGDLDKKSAHDIMELLSKLNSDFNKTIVMVTHDPSAAERATIIRHLDKGDLLPL
ncbi:MAG: ABC transporter ATP-binding protein [Candidatus Kapabacteria bacterium]|nr:ABC transporter ATP-binding protein [Candidatus Kapabacteria bacterium]